MNDAEDRVRAALADLAPAAPADAAAHAGLHRAIARRRRRRTTGRIAAAVLVLAALAGGRAVFDARDAEGPAGYSIEPGGRTGTAPEPGTGTASTTPGSASPDGHVTFGPVAFDLPAGWRSVLNADGSLCLAAADRPGPQWDGCAGLRLYRGELPGYEGAPYEDHGPWGFATSTDPVACPVAGGDVGGDVGPATDDVVVPAEAGTEPIDEGFRPVGDRTATYDQWFARCSLSSYTFTPRAWHLPESDVLIVDVFRQPETEQILASFTFTDG
ncbi:MAG TPA: hypothetical protein VFI47_16585 [Acidimicrobiales bacterium]|nr:hypothetical protein [Acidimicrobiales bacterium]